MSAFLRRTAASVYLREKHGVQRAPTTLGKLASIGGGPVFRHVGKIPIYSTDDLDAWAASLLGPPMRSIAEHRAAKAPTVAKAEESGGLVRTGIAEALAKLTTAKRRE